MGDGRTRARMRDADWHRRWAHCADAHRTGRVVRSSPLVASDVEPNMATRAEWPRRVSSCDRARAARRGWAPRPQLLESAQREDWVRAQERDDLSGITAMERVYV